MDLKTLQYPRHIHKDGAYRIVDTPEACDAAMDAGWVLSPHDAPRGSSEPMTDDLTAPAVPVKRKPGRPSKAKETA